MYLLISFEYVIRPQSLNNIIEKLEEWKAEFTA